MRFGELDRLFVGKGTEQRCSAPTVEGASLFEPISKNSWLGRRLSGGRRGPEISRKRGEGYPLVAEALKSQPESLPKRNGLVIL
jgi:hypothetical protein